MVKEVGTEREREEREGEARSLFPLPLSHPSLTVHNFSMVCLIAFILLPFNQSLILLSFPVIICSPKPLVQKRIIRLVMEPEKGSSRFSRNKSRNSTGR